MPGDGPAIIRNTGSLCKRLRSAMHKGHEIAVSAMYGVLSIILLLRYATVADIFWQLIVSYRCRLTDKIANFYRQYRRQYRQPYTD